MWQLQFDCEIEYEGTKAQCIKRFKEFLNPYPMRLIEIKNEEEIKK